MKFINWLNDQIEFIKDFFTDSVTDKASLTALMKFITLLTLGYVFLKVALTAHKIPEVPFELVMIIIAILFEKQNGRLINHYFDSKIKIGNKNNEV